MPYKDDEIKQLLREERSRGKQPPLSGEVIRKKLEKMRFVQRLLREKDISRFLKSLTAAGLQKGSKDYNLALEAWHDYWDPHRR